MENQQFNYTYKAPTEEERREILSIKRQYSPDGKSESKLERLRRLDYLVKNSAVIFSLCLGIIGCLIFGLGLAMILEWKVIVWGVVICVIGLPPMIFAYPTYKKILNKNKQRYGEEILSLAEELLNEKE